VADDIIARQDAEVRVAEADRGCARRESISPNTRSRANWRIRLWVAEPQSQNVQPYGQPRFVSSGTYTLSVTQ
jgi:hypothetical protein